MAELRRPEGLRAFLTRLDDARNDYGESRYPPTERSHEPPASLWWTLLAVAVAVSAVDVWIVRTLS